MTDALVMVLLTPRSTCGDVIAGPSPEPVCGAAGDALVIRQLA